ncbi:MAG: dipicolinate synthase subunit DpsA [Acetivibrio sp.]
MVINMYDFVLFGGDIRQIYMATYFRNVGYTVLTYGLSHPMIHDICKQASSLTEALHSGTILVGPIPLSKDNDTIPSLTSSSDLNINILMDGLHSEQILFAGMVSPCITNLCKEKGILVYDFLKEDSLAIANGIATAEGAIMEAISKGSGNLHKASVLVLGFGRCAKVLAHKLDGLDACLTICARKDSDLAYADALGYQTCSFCELSSKINDFDYIFNSVPFMVLPKELLCYISKETVIIDIASYPGGLDYTAAKELGLNVSLSLGIPGKVAPKASGEILANYCLKKTFYRKKGFT